MSTVLLESPSEDTLQLVVEIAQKLGIKARYLGDDRLNKLNRAELEQIIDAGGNVENVSNYLAHYRCRFKNCNCA